ncbi:helix-turn-helix transcriptional regulator [Saccharothrix obliqua]|uniref:helix-turn-helix transcriptional regulator n=1 Tax=Saccharothrix obliqua TaxID=2861747 RepID=UPI001C5E0D16|nr:response regulator transcription factor [Saccharothrix obliqua]MBW4717986.1 response regulator transcription factor [Saccharothrix obliqua]
MERIRERIDPIRVVVGIRNELARYGMERLLGSLPRVCSLEIRNSLDEGCRALDEGRFDVFVVALGELGAQPGDLRLGATGPRAAKILVIMDSLGPGDVLRAADAGGHGFLGLADVDAVTLDETLRRIANGEVPMPVGMAHSLLAGVRSGPRANALPPPPPLTAREQQVMSLLVEGMTNKQIARKLRISSHGVKRLVASILAKLNTPNRTLAVAKALQDGWPVVTGIRD